MLVVALDNDFQKDVIRQANFVELLHDFAMVAAMFLHDVTVLLIHDHICCAKLEDFVGTEFKIFSENMEIVHNSQHHFDIDSEAVPLSA